MNAAAENNMGEGHGQVENNDMEQVRKKAFFCSNVKPDSFLINASYSWSLCCLESNFEGLTLIFSLNKNAIVCLCLKKK